jgi:hypothetical protein
MKRYLCILAVIAALPCKNISAQVLDTAKIVKSLNKCWRSLSHEYSTIYGLEDEEVKRYSKQRVCLGKDSVSLYYGVSYAPKYSLKRVNTENYAKTNFDCSKQKLGIATDSVFEVTITSVSKPTKEGKVHKMTDIIAYDGECIYIPNDGVIFKLFDADAKVQGRSAN